MSGRTRALGLVLLAGLATGTLVQARWPDTRSALDCPASRVGWVGEGAHAVARCGQGGLPPASVQVALGLRLALNRAAESDLARLPGVGASTARALVQARPFRTWDQVDAVRGVGPARLRTLQQATELDP